MPDAGRILLVYDRRSAGAEAERLLAILDSAYPERTVIDLGVEDRSSPLTAIVRELVADDLVVILTGPEWERHAPLDLSGARASTIRVGVRGGSGEESLTLAAASWDADVRRLLETIGRRLERPSSARAGTSASAFSSGPATARRSRRAHEASRRRWRVPALGVAGLLIVAGIAVWAATAGGGSSSGGPAQSDRSSDATAILQALAITNRSKTAKHLIPPSSCKSQSATMVTCTHPAFGANTVTIRTFPSLAALYSAYVAQAKSLGQSPFRVNFGDCTERQTYGEVSWNHRYQHPRDYSLAQSASGQLSDDDAAGRVFCTFSNSELHIVWTQNDGRVLGALTGFPHANTWDWWKGVHHSIDIPGSGGGMEMSGPGSSSSMSGSGSSSSMSGTATSTGMSG